MSDSEFEQFARFGCWVQHTVEEIVRVHPHFSKDQVEGLLRRTGVDDEAAVEALRKLWDKTMEAQEEDDGQDS